jgi:hypothetical protein
MQQPGGRWPLAKKNASDRWQIKAIALAGGSLAVFGGLVAAVPAPLVLPVFAGVAFVAGLAAAAYGGVTGAPQVRDRITCWDVASTCVFVGFAAGVLSDPGHVAEVTHLSSAR